MTQNDGHGFPGESFLGLRRQKYFYKKKENGEGFVYTNQRKKSAEILNYHYFYSLQYKRLKPVPGPLGMVKEAVGSAESKRYLKLRIHS